MFRTMTMTLALVCAGATSVLAIGPHVARYSLEGFLDRAPEGARVIASVRVEREGTARTILVTANETTDAAIVCSSCDSPFAATYSFALLGDSSLVEQLLTRPHGTKVSGSFTRTRTDRHLIVERLDSPAIVDAVALRAPSGSAG